MNEVLLQRCVDGELSASERMSFLDSLGDDVASWRLLACRLLEDRLVQAGCVEWLDSAAISSVPAHRMMATEFEAALGNNGFADFHSNGNATQTASIARRSDKASQRRRSIVQRMRSSALLICAAALGVVLGLWIDSRDPSSRSETANGVAAGKSSESPDSDGDALVDVPQAQAFSTIRLTVNTPDGPQDVDVPVIGSDDLALLTSMDSTISPEMREQLSRQGIELDEIPGVITLPIDDARSVAVPVRIGQMRHVGL